MDNELYARVIGITESGIRMANAIKQNTQNIISIFKTLKKHQAAIDGLKKRLNEKE